MTKDLTGKTPLNATEFEQRFPEVRAKVGHFGKIQVDELIKQTTTVEGTTSFALGSIVTITSALAFEPPHVNKPILGQVHLAIFQGTVASYTAMIWPFCGGSVTQGRYRVQGWYDGFPGGTDPAAPQWTGQIVDTGGTSGTVIYVATTWNYIDYTFGNGTANLNFS